MLVAALVLFGYYNVEYMVYVYGNTFDMKVISSKLGSGAQRH